MRSVGLFGLFQSSLIIIHQHWLVVRMCTVLNDNLCSLTWRQASQVCQALLSNNNINIMLSVVNMRAHRHDRRNCTTLGSGNCKEYSQVSITGEVAGAANTIHHLGAHDVSGINIAVNIALNSGIHSDNTNTTCNLRAVSNLLRTQYDMLSVFLDILVETLQSLWRWA